MNTEIINKIKLRMVGELLPEQLKKLEEVLMEILENEKVPEKSIKDNKNVSVRRL